MKKIKQRIINLDLNPKSEFLKFILLNLVLLTACALILFFKFSYIYLTIGIIFVVLGNIGLCFRYPLLEEEKRKRLEIEFVETFSYIRIYLVNKENVYNAIMKANKYSSKEMNEIIQKFLKEIDDDKTIMPFINFGANFKNKVIEEVMVSLYQIVDGGYTDSYMNQFIKVFENFKERMNSETLNKRFSRINTINMMSLLGSAYLMFIMLVVILSILGDYINGI